MTTNEELLTVAVNQVMIDTGVINPMPKMSRSTVIYGYCLMVRNKIVYCLDWLLMRIHTALTGIKHKGSDPRKV